MPEAENQVVIAAELEVPDPRRGQIVDIAVGLKDPETRGEDLNLQPAPTPPAIEDPGDQPRPQVSFWVWLGGVDARRLSRPSWIPIPQDVG